MYEKIGELAATVAGGALGYIHGNTRGARAGAELARKYFKRRMAPIKRKRNASWMSYLDKRKRVRTVSSDSSKKKVGKLVSMAGKLIAGRTGGGPYRTSGSNASFVGRRSGKKVSHKKRARVVVSKKFKKRVRAALDTELRGKYLKVTYNRMRPPVNNGQQSVVDFGMEFTPLDYLDASDVLFNRATAIANPTAGTITWQNAVIRKDHIINSWVSYEWKNMSQRTYTLIMYNAKPKNTPNSENSNDSVADWISGLFIAGGNNTNPEGNTYETLFSDPRDSPLFNQFWSVEQTKIVLQPGQSHTFFVQGPSDFTLDYTKVYSKFIGTPQAWFQGYGKFSRNVFFVGYPDLLTTSLAAAGRFPSGGTSSGGLVCERKRKISMACPESAGFRYPAVTTGVDQQLDNKLPTKIIKIFSEAGDVGNVQDVLEENPLTILNPTD